MQNKIETTFINIKIITMYKKRASTSLYKRGAAEAALTSTVQISKRSSAFFRLVFKVFSDLSLIAARTKRGTHFKKKMDEEEGNSKEEINEEDGGYEGRKWRT